MKKVLNFAKVFSTINVLFSKINWPTTMLNKLEEVEIRYRLSYIATVHTVTKHSRLQRDLLVEMFLRY